MSTSKPAEPAKTEKKIAAPATTAPGTGKQPAQVVRKPAPKR